jgi:hypothetical protein
MNPGSELPTYEYHFDINRATTASLIFPGENGDITRIPFQRFPLSIEALRMNPEINLGIEMPAVIEAQGWFAEGRVTVIGDEVRFVANRHFALKKDKDTQTMNLNMKFTIIKGGRLHNMILFQLCQMAMNQDPIDTYRFSITPEIMCCKELSKLYTLIYLDFLKVSKKTNKTFLKYKY